MSVSRLAVFSSRRYALTAPLPRFVPSVSYTKSTKEKFNARYVYPTGSPSQPSRSFAPYALSAALLGFAGFAAFFHYNDERRALPKGYHQPDSRSENNVNGPIIGVQIMAKAIDILESKEHLKILPVFVTIDPQRDTPAQLRAYLKEFDSRIIGLTGPVTAIRQMAQEYRVYFKKVEDDGGDYLVDCSHRMYLLNPNMEVVRCFGVEYTAEELSEAISKELNRNRC
ncbi:hypothetical protein PIB30_037169 [Stylosanthes scabra]|uniref:Uncharacterized protein n=1 Tax=Stylosanthes scabra TaxID=79078 RepID=A0ABU6UGV7_9FABA|nr:hypothetical protein [Stylosanthes scabra]